MTALVTCCLHNLTDKGKPTHDVSLLLPALVNDHQSSTLALSTFPPSVTTSRTVGHDARIRNCVRQERYTPHLVTAEANARGRTQRCWHLRSPLPKLLIAPLIATSGISTVHVGEEERMQHISTVHVGEEERMQHVELHW